MIKPLKPKQSHLLGLKSSIKIIDKNAHTKKA